MTYELVYNLKYLGMVISEVLRKYPPLPVLDRECNSDLGCQLNPYSDFVVPNKMPILIPIYSIQRDSKVIYLKTKEENKFLKHFHSISLVLARSRYIRSGTIFGREQTEHRSSFVYAIWIGSSHLYRRATGTIAGPTGNYLLYP